MMNSSDSMSKILYRWFTEAVGESTLNYVAHWFLGLAALSLLSWLIDLALLLLENRLVARSRQKFAGLLLNAP